MKSLFRPLFITLACLAAAPGAWAGSLGIGDPAPAIAVRQFVKGTPVPKLPKGRVSVVEFWATWCGPCRESIPHLTEMAKKYPQVTFVGVSVWEEDQSKVVPFVKEMGAKMDYHVAMDRVAPGAKGDSGAMAKTWMMAAGQEGIPTAFIVGKDGRIDWIGHPAEMAEPLAKIAAGAWNTATAKAEFAQKQIDDKIMESVQEAMEKAAQSGDVKSILAAIDQAIAKSPHLEKEELGIAKFTILRGRADSAPDSALAYGKHLVTDIYKDDVEALNAFAWAIVDPDATPKASAEYTALALEAAKHGDTVAMGKNADMADTLAAACFATGDTAGAVAAQTRALKLLGTGDAEEAAKMRTQLATYQKAAAGP